MNRVSIDTDFRALVPTTIGLPCEHSDAVIEVSLTIDADPVRVIAPGLDDIKGVLAIGSAELVRSYCEVWTRYLAQVSRRKSKRTAAS